MRRASRTADSSDPDDNNCTYLIDGEMNDGVAAVSDHRNVANPMTTIMLVVLFTIGVASGLGAPGTVEAERLNPRIGPTDPKLYKAIRDARNWENPYLVFGREGIEVITKSLSSGRQTIAAIDLRRTRVGLPVGAWPYGRVVAVQDTSLRVVDLSDERPIADNRKAAVATLKQLGITIDNWPP